MSSFLFIFFLLIFFFFFLPHHATCGILVPQIGIEPRPPAVEAWSPNHGTTLQDVKIAFLKLDMLLSRWLHSASQWRTEESGRLQSMASQSQTQLSNWTTAITQKNISGNILVPGQLGWFCVHILICTQACTHTHSSTYTNTPIQPHAIGLLFCMLFVITPAWSC